MTIKDSQNLNPEKVKQLQRDAAICVTRMKRRCGDCSAAAVLREPSAANRTGTGRGGFRCVGSAGAGA